MSLNLDAKSKKLRDEFDALKTGRDVANLLDISYSKLMYYTQAIPLREKYTSFTIPKKSGGKRSILNPHQSLKIIQRKLNQTLQHVYHRRSSVHGFLPGKDIKSNAEAHLRQKYVLNIDIKDFFPSINFGRVQGMFMGIPYELPEEVATILARICCHFNILPQGAPTSPIISNMICAQMDSQLEFLASKYHCVYTRYADDLTFSTRSRSFPDGVAKISNAGTIEIGTELDEVIRNNGFGINKQKIRLQNHKHHQEVTGITVNEEPNVSRVYLRQIRAMLYAWDKFGLDNAENEYQSRYNHRHRYRSSDEALFPQVVRGKIEFVGMIRGKKDPLYLRLLSQYEELNSVAKAPVEIQESLQKFRSDHPDSSKNVFVMMQFTDDNSHNQILKSIENLLSNHGLKGLRADYKDYHSDLYFNILTYIYGCGCGIAVFDRINSDDFNPNVSFELGYSLAINKPVCILKDDTHKALQTDLLGKLYKSFSVQDIDGTISRQLLKWLIDKDLIAPLNP